MKKPAKNAKRRAASPSEETDVIIVGAGAAGLAAADALGKAGFSVLVLEARERIGGRIFTLSDPKWQTPVELGAEFIHGRPPEIWELLRRKVRIREVEGDVWCSTTGSLRLCDFFSAVDHVLEKMDDRQPDQSFLEFINRHFPPPRTPRQQQIIARATGYVSGFNAADPALVGVHWLVKGMRAEEKIEGDRAFRAERGYAALLEIFQQRLEKSGVSVQTSTIVERVQWRRGNVEIGVKGPHAAPTLSARSVLITVSLGVLQAPSDERGAILFSPDLPKQKQTAIRDGVMGKVIRVTLRFKERFWKDLPRVNDAPGERRTGPQARRTMDKMSFLLSEDDWFPTWWTMQPQKFPFLVGWAPFHCAERLAGQNESFVVEHCMKTLHRVLGVGVRELDSLFEHAYFHDWQNDPFSRGAYSYGKAGAEDDQQLLAKPVANTLFFAGEATDVGGHNGTVHGAIASGRRAAAEIAGFLARGGSRRRVIATTP